MLVDRRLSVTSPQRYCNRFIFAVQTGCWPKAGWFGNNSIPHHFQNLVNKLTHEHYKTFFTTVYIIIIYLPTYFYPLGTHSPHQRFQSQSVLAYSLKILTASLSFSAEVSKIIIRNFNTKNSIKRRTWFIFRINWLVQAYCWPTNFTNLILFHS